MRPKNEEDCPLSFQPGDRVEVTVTDVAQGGWCVARPSGVPVLFVRHALPGERVVAQVTEVTSRLARADAVEVIEASPNRIEPPCPNARPGGCGGCDWQHATLPAQRALKASVVREQLRRVAGVDLDVTVEPMPGDDDGDGLGWRTRVQFAVSSDGLAGLRAHRSHEVVDIGDCPIAHAGIRDLGIPRRRWPSAGSVESAVDGAAQRQVIVVQAGRGQQVADLPAESVLSRSGRRLTPVRGRAYLTQRAAGREWRVSAGAFWQVHPAAADTLTAAVLAVLEPKPGDAVLDLYCGVGLFAGSLAAAVGSDGTVIGVEGDEAAVRDARHNVRDSPWARVRRGDVGAVLKRGGLPPTRLAVADPPRSGLDRAVIEYLSQEAAEVERFCYVSCDPATLARDIRLLLDRGWELGSLRALDAFPMTHHVECVAALYRLRDDIGAGDLLEAGRKVPGMPKAP